MIGIPGKELAVGIVAGGAVLVAIAAIAYVVAVIIVRRRA
jgi:hypothetical protein